jgi:hypothetical protein
MLDDVKDNMSRRQFGGIPESSPILALLETLHNWYSAIENPDTVISVMFLDFIIALDFKNRNILLSDLVKACLIALVSVISVSTATKNQI